MVRVRV
jgi:hypothetical protein